MTIHAWQAAAVVLGMAGAAGAQTPAGFATVAPIFQKHCLMCHSPEGRASGLVVATAADLLRGGKHAPDVLPGNSAGSRLVQMLDGTLKPRMPLGGELTAGDIAAIRAWIDAGAKPPQPGAAAPPAGIPELAVPTIKPSATLASPIYAVAFSRDGRYIALGGYREVRVLAARDGHLLWTLGGHADAVRALVFSSDGSWLAAAGGPPQRGGEIKIWNLPGGTLRASLYGHRDGIYALAVSPDNQRLASGSYDKQILLWQVPASAADRQPPKLLKDHNDAVFALAFSPDGRRLASGSADRTVKIWDVASGRRLYTLGDALDVVNTVAFSPDGRHLAAAGMDKTIRTYLLGDKQATLDQTMIAHEDSVLHLVYTPDGKQIVSTASDHTLKVFDAATLNPLRDLADEPDWVQAMALSPDGQDLALGQYNGQFTVLNLATDKPVLGPLVGFAASPLVATARP